MVCFKTIAIKKIFHFLASVYNADKFHSKEKKIPGISRHYEYMYIIHVYIYKLELVQTIWYR